jgi:hypothetical protein
VAGRVVTGGQLPVGHGGAGLPGPNVDGDRVESGDQALQADGLTRLDREASRDRRTQRGLDATGHTAEAYRHHAVNGDARLASVARADVGRAELDPDGQGTRGRDLEVKARLGAELAAFETHDCADGRRHREGAGCEGVRRAGGDRCADRDEEEAGYRGSESTDPPSGKALGAAWGSAVEDGGLHGGGEPFGTSGWGATPARANRRRRCVPPPRELV